MDPADVAPSYAEEVREQSVRRIGALGLPQNPDLPLLEEPVVRDDSEVVGRTLTLNAVMARAYGTPQALVEGWLRQEGLTEALSPLERDLVAGRNQLPWQIRVECLWAFIWALGFGDDLDPTKRCPDTLVRMLPSLKARASSSGFRDNARLRAPRDLYAEADFHYLVTWAAREVALSGTTSLVEGPEVFERRRALDWIIAADVDWDDVTLDT